jgi:ubiquinone/menaquinone biosynthesis C-methylase UbiE
MRNMKKTVVTKQKSRARCIPSGLATLPESYLELMAEFPLRPIRWLAAIERAAFRGYKGSMHMRAGIPLAIDSQEIVAEQEFQQHLEFHEQFRQQHREAMKDYQLPQNPLQVWSRRWEYPFAAQRVFKFAQDAGDRPLKMLDAGAGVTYFPYFLSAQLPQLKVTCVDSDAAYQPIFERINQATPSSRVEFRPGMLQSLPVESGEMDILTCISALEETEDYGAVLSEFARVLRPGGLLVVTFEISLDGKWKLTQGEATKVLRELQHRFQPEELLDLEHELASLKNPEQILSTNFVRKTEPKLLPPSFSIISGVRDLLGGKGWTGGFRSASIFCISVRAPHPDETQVPSPPASSTAPTD